MKVARGDAHSSHGIFIFGRTFPTAIVVLKGDHFLFFSSPLPLIEQCYFERN